MDDYVVAFGSPGADTYIRNSRAVLCKVLGIDEGFFTNFERMQVKSAVGRKVIGIGLIESDMPVPKRTKFKEATGHTLKCLWGAYRVSKHNCDVAYQSIVHQSFFTKGQKMQILLSQTKESKCMTAIAANELRLCIGGLSYVFLWREHVAYPFKTFLYSKIFLVCPR